MEIVTQKTVMNQGPLAHKVSSFHIRVKWIIYRYIGIPIFSPYLLYRYQFQVYEYVDGVCAGWECGP